MVIITPSLKVPVELQDDSVMLHVPPPSAGELCRELDSSSRAAAYRAP